jgi:hypothetical protein
MNFISFRILQVPFYIYNVYKSNLGPSNSDGSNTMDSDKDRNNFNKNKSLNLPSHQKRVANINDIVNANNRYNVDSGFATGNSYRQRISEGIDLS